MKQRRKGFTLVELIVVIAIIGILAAVLIPTFSGAIESARKADDRLTVSNMNKTLTTYLAYHQIDAKDLDASEVQYIVSTEEEQYTFQPAYEGGVFWYNSNAGRIEYAETMGNPSATLGTTGALANDGIHSIEDVYGNGYLYLNTNGELATFLLNLRNLGSVEDYKNLASAVYETAEGNVTATPKPIEGVDVSAVYKKYDPAQTLYISSAGGFIDTRSYTSNTYSNKPVYTDGSGWTMPDETSVTFKKAGEEGTGTPSKSSTVMLASTLINQGVDKLTGLTTAGGDYWVIQENSSGTLTYYEVKDGETWVQPVQNTIKNVVFATGIRVVPALNIGVNIMMEEDIQLPATVYTVMKDAFTNVVSETRLVAKSQYAEVITGALGANMTTSIAEKSEEDLKDKVQDGNNLLKVYLVQHGAVYDNGFLGVWRTSYQKLAEVKKWVKDDNTIVKTDTTDVIGYVLTNTSTGEFIGKIDATAYPVGKPDKNGDTDKDGKLAYRLYLDTSDLVMAFPTIHTIDVKYAPRSMDKEEVFDITIQAFDSSGMCLNIVVTYKQFVAATAAA